MTGKRNLILPQKVLSSYALVYFMHTEIVTKSNELQDQKNPHMVSLGYMLFNRLGK